MNKRFGGDVEQAKDYMIKLGLFAADYPYIGTPIQKFSKPSIS